MESLCRCLSAAAAGGGGGACLGAMKSSLATDLLGAVGRVEERGGGTTSKLARGGSSGPERVVSREAVLSSLDVTMSLVGGDCACAPLLLLLLLLVVVVVVLLLLSGSGVDCLDLAAAAAAAAALSESPRSGRLLSACRGGMGVLAGAATSLRLGSSKGLMLEFCEATEAGDTGLPLPGSPSLLLPSAGDTVVDDGWPAREFFRESARFEGGTSPRRKPSCGLDWPLCEFCCSVGRECGCGLDAFRSGGRLPTGEAVMEPFTGVSLPEVSRFRLRPFS